MILKSINKIKQKLKKWIIPKHLQQMKKLSKNEDISNFGTLNNANDRLIESKQNSEEEKKNIKETYETKEEAIINLYARQKGISEEEAKLIYRQSQLKNIIRDKESTLYLESAYYI